MPWKSSIGFSCFQKLTFLVEILKIFENQIDFFWNSKFSTKNRKMTPSQKIEAGWKSQWHYHMVLTLTQDQTSIPEEYFPCCTFSYRQGFVIHEHVWTGPCYKKSRCPWDGVYLRTSITLRALPSDGNERWTVNLVPARITHREGAPPSMDL